MSVSLESFKQMLNDLLRPVIETIDNEGSRSDI